MTWSDTNTGAQWGIDGSADTAAGQNLVFNSSGAGTVTLSGAVNPASITVNNAAGGDYVFASDGTGKIAQGTLTKRGEGKLTLNLDNTGWAGAISSSRASWWPRWPTLSVPGLSPLRVARSRWLRLTSSRAWA